MSRNNLDAPFKYRFCVLEYDEETFEEGTRFESKILDPENSEWVAEMLAQDVAEYYFHNCDGWEARWPLTFRLWSPEGALIGDFGVELEAVPSFSARKINA